MLLLLLLLLLLVLLLLILLLLVVLLLVLLLLILLLLLVLLLLPHATCLHSQHGNEQRCDVMSSQIPLITCNGDSKAACAGVPALAWAVPAAEPSRRSTD